MAQKTAVRRNEKQDWLPELNLELLKQLIKWAEYSEKGSKAAKNYGFGTWDQGSWAVAEDEENDDLKKSEVNLCNTAYCIAGQAVVQTGHRLKLKGDDGYWEASECVKQYDTGEVLQSGRPKMKDAGRPKPIDRTAAKELGLTRFEAGELFAGSNDIDRLKEIVNGLCESRGLRRPYSQHDAYEFDYEYYNERDRKDALAWPQL